MSTKFGTKHLRWSGFCPFPREDNKNLAKIHWRNLIPLVFFQVRDLAHGPLFQLAVEPLYKTTFQYNSVHIKKICEIQVFTSVFYIGFHNCCVYLSSVILAARTPHRPCAAQTATWPSSYTRRGSKPRATVYSWQWSPKSFKVGISYWASQSRSV